MEKSLAAWLARVKLLVCDVDGALTDLLRFLCGLAVLMCADAGGQSFTGFKLPFPFEGSNAPPVGVVPYKTLLSLKELSPFTNTVYRGLGMEIENRQPDGKTNLIARAPECLFDREARVASSTNRLELESPNGLTIEGIGFLCYLTNFNLIISNEVHTVVLQQLLQGAPELGGIG